MSHSTHSPRRYSLAAVAAITAMMLAACGSGGGDNATSGQSPAGAGQSGSAAAPLETVTPGKLTIATGDPAFSPWVEDNDPASGKGFESAVAYAVAEKMGFAAEDVVWIRTPFDTAIAPGPKDFDMNLQQFSITPERAKVVDFSSPYYTTSQAVLSAKGNKGADATTLAGLKDVQFGVAAGTNAAPLIEEQIAPSKQISIFNSNDDAVAALKAGQIDALVTDLPTVVYLASAAIDNGTVVGQFDPALGGDQYAFLLPKDSPLTPSVSSAVDELQAAGTLDELAKKWIPWGTEIPVLK